MISVTDRRPPPTPAKGFKKSLGLAIASPRLSDWIRGRDVPNLCGNVVRGRASVQLQIGKLRLRQLGNGAFNPQPTLGDTTATTKPT